MAYGKVEIKHICLISLNVLEVIQRTSINRTQLPPSEILVYHSVLFVFTHCVSGSLCLCGDSIHLLSFSLLFHIHIL